MKRTLPKIRKHQPDLTRTKRCEKSVGARIETLVVTCNQYELEELKKRLTEVLDNPETSISKAKIYEYKNHMNNIYNKMYMMEFIKNIYLASANMGVE